MVLIREVMRKGNKLESVWQAWKPINSPRLYLKLKTFKADLEMGKYKCYFTEEKTDRLHYWYTDDV